MKNISRLALPLLLAAFFATPLFASAITCIPPQVVDLSNSNNCITPNTLPGSVANTPYTPSSSGGNINLTIAQGYRDSILSAINNIFVPVLFAVAFLVFLWGVYKYFILGAAEEKSREEGRNFVLWGIIGFVVILSVWGLVAIVGNTFSLTAGGTAPSYPTL